MFDGEIAVKYYHGGDEEYLVASWSDVAFQDVHDMLKLDFQFAVGKLYSLKHFTFYSILVIN